MQTVHWLETSQRSILVMVPTWIIWCGLIAFSAPYRPDGVAFMLFLFSTGICFLGCSWMMAPLMPERFGLFTRLLSQTISGVIPFAFIVLIGHYLGTATRHWLS